MFWLKSIWKWIRILSGTTFLIGGFVGLGVAIYLSIFRSNDSQVVDDGRWRCPEWKTEMVQSVQLPHGITATKYGTYCVKYNQGEKASSLSEARWASYKIEFVGKQGLIETFGAKEATEYDHDKIDIAFIPTLDEDIVSIIEVGLSASNVFPKLSVIKISKLGLDVIGSVLNPITNYQSNNRSGSVTRIDGFYSSVDGNIYIDTLVPDEGNSERCNACAEYHIVTKQLVDEKFVDVDKRPFEITFYQPYTELAIYKEKFNVSVTNHPYKLLDISIQWWPERIKSTPYERASVLGKVGMAEISLSHKHSGEVVRIDTHRFHVPSSHIKYPFSNDIYLNSKSLPTLSLLEVNSAHRGALDWSTPFIFEDIDFDGKSELLIINHGQGQRMGHDFEVYDIEEEEEGFSATLKDVQPFNELDWRTEFDSENNQITIYRSGGACLSEYETYEVNQNDVKPIELIQYDSDKQGCYKYTYAYKLQNEKYDRILLSKEAIR